MLNKHVVPILLAAGESARLGRPKQLVQYHHRSLLHHALSQLTSAGFSEVVVVIGCWEEEVRRELQTVSDLGNSLPLHIVYNPNWRRGIGSSIKRGVQFALDAFPPWHGFLFCLVDQPLIPPLHFRHLIDAFDPLSSPQVATKYGASIGVPAVFAITCYEQIYQLSDDRGCRQLLRSSPVPVVSITCERAVFDVDTDDDVKWLGWNAITAIS